MTELPIVVNMTVDASRTEYDLTAESNLEEIELLNDTVIETGGSHVPVYEGPYTVDAGLNAVTLDTDGKRLTQDVTVNALQEMTLNAPTISVDSSNGQITASVNYTPGYNDMYVVVPTMTPLSTQARATITPTTSEQTAVARGKYTTGEVKVGAIPTGTRGTPTATKGTVSNHSVSVTPSVTNTTGYIEGGTKSGTAVSVSASELVSGNKAITRNGNNIDVVNYSTVSVNVPTVTPTGTIPITQNGTYDVTNYSTAEVSVSGASQTWFSAVGDLYTEEMEIPQVSGSSYRFAREAFKNATHLKKFILTWGNESNDSYYGLFRGCTALEVVTVSRYRYDTYCFENCNALKTITLGRIGYAVTTVTNNIFNSVGKTHIESITVYVNASDLSGVPTAVKDRITPSYSHGAVITYKNYSSGDTIATVTVP